MPPDPTLRPRPEQFYNQINSFSSSVLAAVSDNRLVYLRLLDLEKQLARRPFTADPCDVRRHLPLELVPNLIQALPENVFSGISGTHVLFSVGYDHSAQGQKFCHGLCDFAHLYTSYCDAISLLCDRASARRSKDNRRKQPGVNKTAQCPILNDVVSASAPPPSVSNTPALHLAKTPSAEHSPPLSPQASPSEFARGQRTSPFDPQEPSVVADDLLSPGRYPLTPVRDPTLSDFPAPISGGFSPSYVGCHSSDHGDAFDDGEDDGNQPINQASSLFDGDNGDQLSDQGSVPHEDDSDQPSYQDVILDTRNQHSSFVGEESPTSQPSGSPVSHRGHHESLAMESSNSKKRPLEEPDGAIADLVQKDTWVKGQWLNDVLEALCDAKSLKVSLVDSAQLSRMAQDKCKPSERLIQHVLSTNVVLLPLHLNSSHWALAVVRHDVGAATAIHYYDSLPCSKGIMEAQRLVDSFITGFLPNTIRSRRRIEKSSCPAQDDHDDCGVFTFAFAMHAITAQPLRSSLHTGLWRRLMASLLGVEVTD
ncbi:hypothetical protein ColTof4_14322 [Colletotrichum tofieldiae]|nr:hypothetical protein ColTof3_14731 [Colletotrichum tofieldiae]GKT81899.1 hypothetical protein ColTof4_14322 [Colletotrichum tofieldiae]